MPEVDRVMFMTSPLIVWAHEGRVVDLGNGWREGDPEVSQALVEEGAWSGQATAVNSTSCREETRVPDNILGEYDNERPGAHYELRVVTSTSAGHPDRNALLVSNPITVDLDSGVAPLPTFAEPSGDCSGAAYAGRGMMAPNLPEPVRATAADLLAAATTCDEGQIAELGGQLDTVPYGLVDPPSVNEVFALPEADGRSPYATVARLLSETTPDRDLSSWTWPRVSRVVKYGDDDAAWQEAIDAGAITEEQAAVDRAAGRYTGWRLRIDDVDDPGQLAWGAFYEGDWCSSPDAEPDCS